MKLTDLRSILQYIPQFREKIFILAIDGAIVTDDNFATLLLDVALLWSLNIRVVLVHGASAQIRTLATERNVPASDFDGSGVTDAATLDLALAAANRLTHEILEGLSANDLRAASTNVIIAHPAGIIQGVDHLFTGKVERVDAELLQSLLAQGVVPVIPPLGFDGDGKTYRVNSDGVAVAVAEQLKAIKLIFVTTRDGLLYRGQLIRQMLVDELAKLVQQESAGFPPDMLSKAQHAAAACNAGVSTWRNAAGGKWDMTSRWRSAGVIPMRRSRRPSAWSSGNSAAGPAASRRSSRRPTPGPAPTRAAFRAARPPVRAGHVRRWRAEDRRASRSGAASPRG